MPTKSSSAPVRSRIGPGPILLFGAGACLLLLVLVVGGAWLGSRRHLDAELERIRAAGEKVSVEETEAFYLAPAAGQDTTQLWLAALAPLDTLQFQADTKDLPFFGEGSDVIPWPSESWPQLEPAEHLLSRYRASLEEMHQAARQGGRARFPTRFADGIALPIDPFNGVSLHYQVDAAEYIVYSVGNDGVDNGGVSEPPGQSADIVVRLRLKNVEPGSPAPRS